MGRSWHQSPFGISSGAFIPHQAASIGDSFATAGGRIARAFELHHEDQLRETELQKENTELREQLDELATPRRPGYMQQYGAVLPLPSVGDSHAGPNSTKRPVESPERLRMATDGDRDDSLSGVGPEHPAIRIGGGWWKTNPFYADSEVYEQRYGEPGEWVSGAINGVADLVATGLYWGQRGYQSYTENIGEPIGDWLASRVDGAPPNWMSDPGWDDAWRDY